MALVTSLTSVALVALVAPLGVSGSGRGACGGHVDGDVQCRW